MAARDDADTSPAEPGPQRWFVVANASRAKAFVQRVGAPGYDVVRTWDSPEDRASGNKPGEDRDAGAGGATAHTPRGLTEALVEDLAQALRRRELSGLYLLAPAPLLHRLRDALPADLRRALDGEGTGDFTQRPTADVFAHLDSIRREAGTEAGLPRAR